jgi:flavin reductase (DIM6/NTAB) family NADH-FMN oxidoreductase RutF
MAMLGGAVSVITTDGVAGRFGFTASAVCSVTDSPPTLLVCMNRASHSNEHFKRNGFSNVTSKIWPGTRHETLNDTVRGRATAEFAAWARAALPSPAPAV